MTSIKKKDKERTKHELKSLTGKKLSDTTTTANTKGLMMPATDKIVLFPLLNIRTDKNLVFERCVCYFRACQSKSDAG